MYRITGAKCLVLFLCAATALQAENSPNQNKDTIAETESETDRDPGSASYREIQRQEENYEVSPCSLNNPSDAVRCALKNAPGILEARARFQESRAAMDVADNVPNPRLQGNYMFGKNSAELEYRHIIELGDRRDLRTDSARSEARARALDWEIARQNTVLSVVMALYQLEHLQEEQRYLEETIQAFNAAIYRLYRLPSRDANQNTSLYTYIMARDSLRQQKLDLLDRRNQLRRELEMILGHPLEDKDLDRISASHPESWPDLPGEYSRSLEIARVNQEVARAAYEHRIESSRVWPDISIGPRLTVERSSELLSGSKTQSNVGLSFSITMPLYNQYSGSEDRARAVEKQRQIEQKTTVRSIESEYRYMVRSYREHVQGIKNNPSMRTLEGRRYAVLNYMRRGLLNPALLVEFHRSYGEHIHQFHTSQLRALGMLWRSYALTGRILDDEVIDSIR